MADNIAGNSSTKLDFSNLIGSGISAGSGLLGSLIAGGYNRKRARESMAWAEKMQAQTNEYNLPINQVARLREAGINPSLAFGSAASAMGTNVGSVPHYSDAPDYAAPVQRGINDYFSRKYEKMQLLSQIAWQNEQTREKQMDNETKSLLLDDYRAMKRSEYNLGSLRNEVDSKLYGRQRNLEVDLLSAKWLNELDRYFAHVPQALSSHYRAQDALLRNKTMSEYQDYLTKKSRGQYERSYFDRGLNPYETSTIAGGIRTLLGALGIVGNDNKEPTPSSGSKIKEGLGQAREQYNDYKYGRRSFWHDVKHYWRTEIRRNSKSFKW